MASSIRVLLVEDHPIMRDGLRCDLDGQPDFEVVGEAATVSEARQLAEALCPDLLLLDIRLPDGSGLDIARWSRRQLPTTRILILSAFNDEYTRAAKRLGVHGYLSKAEAASTIIDAARTIARGEVVYPEVSRPTASSPAQEQISGAFNVLSPRELEVARLIEVGATDAEIAVRLCLSAKTVAFHLQNIRLKLGIRNRTEVAVLVARFTDSELMARPYVADGELR